MLIISRAVGEAVVIGSRITLSLTAKHKDRVMLGVKAPQGTTCTEFVGGEATARWETGERVMIRRGTDVQNFVRFTLPNGDHCDVCVFTGDYNRKWVRFGFAAPRTLSVDRLEIAVLNREKRRAETQAAAAPMLAVVALCATLLTGCATGSELRGTWMLTVGRSGTCRVVGHRASTDQLQSSTTWRGEGCPSVTPPTEEPARGINGEVLK